MAIKGIHSGWPYSASEPLNVNPLSDSIASVISKRKALVLFIELDVPFLSCLGDKIPSFASFRTRRMQFCMCVTFSPKTGIKSNAEERIFEAAGN